MITKRQFLDAQRIIRQYQEQRTTGSYQFLYWENPTDEDPQVKYIEATMLSNACFKMLEWIQSSGVKIDVLDYQVKFGGEFYDISDDPRLKDYVG